MALRMKEPLTEEEQKELKIAHSRKYFYVSSEGDGGYLDAYNRLKAKGDAGRTRYFDKIKSSDLRRKQMKKDLMTDVQFIVGYLLVSFLYVGALKFFEISGTTNGFIGGLYTMMNLFKYPFLFIIFLVMFPISLGRFCKRFMRYGIMTEMALFENYRIENGIISLKEEKRRCAKAIEDYDSFIKALYSDDTKDVYPARNYHKEYTEMSDTQRDVIDRMEALAEFPDFYSNSLDNMRDLSSPVWLYAGVIFFIALIVIAEIIVLVY